MKKIIFVLIFAYAPWIQAQIAINNDGSNPDSSAMLDIKSTTSGLLIPRMTASERNNIGSPATGLLVFVTDDNTFYYYDGSAWVKASADNLGNHIATENIKTNGHWISNDGDDEGIFIHTDGTVYLENHTNGSHTSFEIKSDDPDIELNMNSNSSVASMIEYRFSIDDTIRSSIYYHKDERNLYISQKTHSDTISEGKTVFLMDGDSSLVLLSNGNVGIHQTNPQYKLDVNGIIRHGEELRFYTPNNDAGRTWVRVKYANNIYGENIYIGAGAITAIGGGESASYIMNNVNNDPGYEILYLGSDINSNTRAIQVITKLQDGWDNRVEAVTITGYGYMGLHGITLPKGVLHIPHLFDGGVNSSSQTSDLVIGSMGSSHLELDNNEINAMRNGTQVSNLLLNYDGGGILMGRSANENVKININGGGNTYALNLPNNSDLDVGRARAYAWVTYSDNRIKSDIRRIKNSLELVKRLHPVRYMHHSSRFITGGEKDDTIRGIEILPQTAPEYGYIAQELYQVIPEAVHKPANEQTDLWGVNYQMIIPVLNAAIQEQQKTIEKLEQRIKELEQKLQN